MTLLEFKAWLDGFEEAIDGAPTKEQWRKIKAKMNSVTNAKSVEVHHHDHYRPYYPYWYHQKETWKPDLIYCSTTTGTAFNKSTTYLSWF